MTGKDAAKKPGNEPKKVKNLPAPEKSDGSLAEEIEDEMLNEDIPLEPGIPPSPK